MADNFVKFSYLDAILVNSNLKANTAQTLYTSSMNDMITQTNTFFLPLSSLFQSEYQETFSTTLVLAPELAIMFNDYLSTYFFSNFFNNLPTAVFDSYTNNLNFHVNLGSTYFVFFALYAWFIVFLFSTVILLK